MPERPRPRPLLGIRRSAGNCFRDVRPLGYLLCLADGSGQVLQIRVLLAPTSAIAYLQPDLESVLG